MNKLKLTNQACGSIMMAIQKAFQNVVDNKPKEQCDVSLMLKEFELEETVEGLVVLNPPTLDYTTMSNDDEEAKEE